MNTKLFCSLPILLLALGCGDGELAQESVEDLQSTTPDTITVVPSDTIGILMGDSNYVFGTIGDAVSFENGNIAVLDETGCCAKVYDSDCNFLNQISRS